MIRSFSSGRALQRTGALAALVCALFIAVAAPASAQDAATVVRSITTPYPSVAVQPGSTVQLDLTVSSPVIAAVGLDVASPPGWTTTLRGGGFVISGITASPDRAGSAKLEIDVPVDAAVGDHDITVTARFPTGNEQLHITLRVQEVVDSGVELSADFPSLQGGPKDTFTYTVTVRNNTPEQQTFTFAAAGPAGWQVEASPEAQTRANTLSIDAGGSGSVKLTATPSPTTAAGQYDVNLTVTAANGASGTGTFTAVVTGTPELDLQTADGTLNASGQAGASTTMTLLVTNTGTAPMDSVRLSATPPKNWKVTFDPETVNTVAAGETAQVVATIEAPSDAIAGDYALGIRASSGTLSGNLAVRFALETSSWVGFVAIIVIVAALLVLGLVYRRFGRR